MIHSGFAKDQVVIPELFVHRTEDSAEYREYSALGLCKRSHLRFDLSRSTAGTGENAVIQQYLWQPLRGHDAVHSAPYGVLSIYMACSPKYNLCIAHVGCQKQRSVGVGPTGIPFLSIKLCVQWPVTSPEKKKKKKTTCNRQLVRVG